MTDEPSNQSPATNPYAASQTEPATARASAWGWVPSLYFAEAVPYVLVASVSALLFKDLGISNSQIATSTSLLYLPWVIKPLWSPLVDILARKRSWIIALQVVLALSIAAIGWAVSTNNFLLTTLAVMWVIAIASATHDIAADGFYLIGLPAKQQAVFVGIRSAFYRLGWISTQGLLVVFAGRLATSGFDKVPAWSLAFYVAGGCFGAIALYHAWVLPRCERAKPPAQFSSIGGELVDTVVTFFRKPGVTMGLAYLLFYRFAEAQLAKIAQPFLLDKREVGGLGLSVESVGVIYGTFGVAMLVVGGILGGLAVARWGLGRWMLPMAAAINLPNAAYLALAYAQPEGWLSVAAAVGVEQFGYGFGFAGYMLYMLYLSRGEHETAHFALCTGVMALGMMLPGYFSGDIQQSLGYTGFFVYILLATIPSFVVTALLKVDRDFGRGPNRSDAAA